MTRPFAFVAVAAAIVLGGRGALEVPASPRRQPDASPLCSEHRYRIVGRIRLGLFWTHGKQVGTARMAARTTPHGTELTFLAGSDPASAPNRLNLWGYLREETNANSARAFVLRRLPAEDSATRGSRPAPAAQPIAASCGFLQADGIRSLLTSVDGDGTTYRMFDRLLDRLAIAQRWEERRLPQSAGITVGLLSAMAQIMRSAGGGPASLVKARPVSYVYGGGLYELSVRGARDVGPANVDARRFERATRVDFGILSGRTRETTRFSAVFAPEEGHLPVQIFFQPSFWVRVELRIDDRADVPRDPAADVATLQRIRALCSDAAQRAAHTATGGRMSAPRN